MKIRYFVSMENHDFTHEIKEAEFLELTDPQDDGWRIQYKRHTVFDNGVNQVCLTVFVFEYEPAAICDICGELHHESDTIQTEDCFNVGPCCEDELRVTGYSTEHESETFYHVN